MIQALELPCVKVIVFQESHCEFKVKFIIAVYPKHSLNNTENMSSKLESSIFLKCLLRCQVERELKVVGN